MKIGTMALLSIFSTTSCPVLSAALWLLIASGCEEKPKPVALNTNGEGDLDAGSGSEPGSTATSKKDAGTASPLPAAAIGDCGSLDPNKVYLLWSDQQGRYNALFDLQEAEAQCVFNAVSSFVIQGHTGKLVTIANGVSEHTPDKLENVNGTWKVTPIPEKALTLACGSGDSPGSGPGGTPGEILIHPATSHLMWRCGDHLEDFSQMRSQVYGGLGIAIDNSGAVLVKVDGANSRKVEIVMTDGTRVPVNTGCGGTAEMRGTDPTGWYEYARAARQGGFIAVCGGFDFDGDYAEYIALDGETYQLGAPAIKPSNFVHTLAAVDGDGFTYSIIDMQLVQRCSPDGICEIIWNPDDQPPAVLNSAQRAYVTAGDPGRVAGLITGP